MIPLLICSVLAGLADLGSDSPRLALSGLGSHTPDSGAAARGAAQGAAALLSVETDLARYTPGQVVRIRLSGPKALGLRARVRIFHLSRQIGDDWTQPWTGHLTYLWRAPTGPVHGYLVVAELFATARTAGIGGASAGDATAIASCGIDVSDRWTDYPRYGYVAHFGPQLARRSGDIFDFLNRFHIDGVQFYDWQWKHHHPLAPTETWPDIAKRETSADTVRTFIREAHARNMASMAYNLGFGAVDGYEMDGISPTWGLFKDAAGKSRYALDMPSGWETTKLYLLDPGNSMWRKTIDQREKDAVDYFSFDGWHMDQLGDLGNVYTGDGANVDLKSRFPALLRDAKASVPGALIFNNVGGYGLDETLASPVDAIYLEAWHWMGQKTYVDLKKTIERMRSGGKSAILAAYMDYELAKRSSDETPGQFNLPGILLADATIFASGGFHLELGDESKMLCNEYFPNHNLEPDEQLLTTLRPYYDFVVAYEDLLSAPNVQPTDVPIQVDEESKGEVWTFARRCGPRLIVHLINLKHPDLEEWRDPEGTHPRAEPLRNIRLTIPGDWHNAFVATPDDGLGAPRRVSLTHGQLIVPNLEYWTVVVLE